MTAVESEHRVEGSSRAAPVAPGPAASFPPSAGISWELPAPGRIRRLGTGRPWLAPAAVGVGLALATAYTSWQDPNGSGAYPGCPLRAMTGWDCPGCGGLRATHALTQGDIFGALDHNVFVAIGVPLAALLWVRWMVLKLGVRVPGLPKVSRTAWWALGIIVVAFTVVRNIPGVGAFEYLNSFT